MPPAQPFPRRWLWTWDHSTNWALGHDGLLDFGSTNRYLKPPDAFLDDYTRLIDAAAACNVNGIIIWGLLRDAHGGVDAVNELCARAAARGIDIIAGVGTSEYGGFYYDGNHPFNAATRAAAHPDGACPTRAGCLEKLCPNDPANIQWLRDGTQWLLEETAVAGINLENGDFSACPNQRCADARARSGRNDPDYYLDMLASYVPVVEQARKTKPEAIVSYATYTGFLPGDPAQRPDVKGLRQPFMQQDEPLFVSALPDDCLAQWNVAGMIHHDKQPLDAALDESPYWPRGLKPPTKHNLAFVHQGSQWHTRAGVGTRYSQEIAAIREACRRSHESSLDGVIIHGEVSNRCVPYELNYLAFAHFTQYPTDTVHQFAERALAAHLGGPDRAATFINVLARCEAQTLTAADRAALTTLHDELKRDVTAGRRYAEYRRWRWLAHQSGALPGAPQHANPHGIYY